MSLDKAIRHGKEHRIEPWKRHRTRNLCWCSWCRDWVRNGESFRDRRERFRADDAIKDAIVAYEYGELAEFGY